MRSFAGFSYRCWASISEGAVTGAAGAVPGRSTVEGNPVVGRSPAGADSAGLAGAPPQEAIIINRRAAIPASAGSRENNPE
jgi:hypothetical protein